MGEPRRCWLRWHNYSDSVTSALESLRYDEDFLDVTVACEGRSLRAHKLVLSACSAYFRKVLKDHPCDHPIIILDGVGWQEVVALLSFMYCGQVVVEETQVAGLLSAATSLSVTGLAHVTTALASTQASREEDSEDEDFEDDDEQEEEEEEEQPAPKVLPQASSSKKKMQQETEESEGDSSYDSDAPPAKRQRTHAPLRPHKPKPRSRPSSKEASTTPPPLLTPTHNGGGVSNRSAASPTQPAPSTPTAPTPHFSSRPPPPTPQTQAATPSPAAKSSSTDRLSNGSNKENEQGAENLVETGWSMEDKEDEDEDKASMSGEGNKELVNGDCIKEETMDEMELVVEALESAQPENGDSDAAVAVAKKLAEVGLLKREAGQGVGGGKGVVSNPTAVSYVSFLPPGALLPSPASNKANTTILLSHTPGLSSGRVGDGGLEQVVQQVLMPSLPSTTNTVAPRTLVALAPVPTLTTTSTTTAATSTTTSIAAALSSAGCSQASLLLPGSGVQATLEQYQRRLAFHEPRPCPKCRRMYRDAATLRTHMAIMHSEGREPFSCSCGALFPTKYDMYQHKKNGHR